MNKITAVGKLTNGECDSILHGTSEFILHGEDIVNKRSKKVLDMKKMLEEGWDIKTMPKWDDALRNGEVRPTLCVLKDEESFVIISYMTQDGQYYTSCGNHTDGKVQGAVRPATRDEVLSLLADTEVTTRQKPKSKPKPKQEHEKCSEPDPEPETAEEGIDLMGEVSVKKQPEDEPNPKDDIEDGVDLEENIVIKTKSNNTAKMTAPKPPVEQKAECLTEKLKPTPSPKAGSNLKEQYVALGLNQNLWEEFCSYCFDNRINTQDTMDAGMASATSLIVNFGADRAKKNKAVGTKKTRDLISHEPDDVIIEKLKGLADFGHKTEDILEFIDNKLPDGEEIYLFSSEEYPLEFDKDEWEEVEGNPILWKTCLMDNDGGINRETISDAFLSEREALMDFYKNRDEE